MKEAIGTGSTVEEAKEAACRELGVESYEAEFEILELPTKKTFGLFGGSPAKVRVYIQDDPAEAAAQYLRRILSCMDAADAEVTVKREDDGAMVCLSGDNIGFIIGHRGETLDALQYLAGLVANHKSSSGYYRVTLDIGNYREKRQQTLTELGKKMAEKSLRLGRNMSLEPMNPYERRIIHTSVQTVEGAKSWSEGEDLERHVVIGPVDGEKNPRRAMPPRRPFAPRPAQGGARPYPPRGPRPGAPVRPAAPGVRPAAPITRPAAPVVPAAPFQRPAVPAAPAVPKPAPKSEAKGSLYGKVQYSKPETAPAAPAVSAAPAAEPAAPETDHSET